jgi:hypothetical protein
MSFVQRLTPRATLSERRVTGKEMLDALDTLKTLKTQKDPQGETLRAVESALLGNDSAIAKKAYGMLGIMKERAPEMMGTLEALQDELMNRLRERDGRGL